MFVPDFLVIESVLHGINFDPDETQIIEEYNRFKMRLRISRSFKFPVVSGAFIN